MFFINHPNAYRKDPNAACVQLKQKWAAKRTEKALGKELPDIRDVQTAPTKSTKPTVPIRSTRATVSTVQRAPCRQTVAAQQTPTVQHLGAVDRHTFGRTGSNLGREQIGETSRACRYEHRGVDIMMNKDDIDKVVACIHTEVL